MDHIVTARNLLPLSTEGSIIADVFQPLGISYDKARTIVTHARRLQPYNDLMNFMEVFSYFVLIDLFQLCSKCTFSAGRKFFFVSQLQSLPQITRIEKKRHFTANMLRYPDMAELFLEICFRSFFYSGIPLSEPYIASHVVPNLARIGETAKRATNMHALELAKTGP